jgi:hypothetical protein
VDLQVRDTSRPSHAVAVSTIRQNHNAESVSWEVIMLIAQSCSWHLHSLSANYLGQLSLLAAALTSSEKQSWDH